MTELTFDQLYAIIEENPFAVFFESQVQRKCYVTGVSIIDANSFIVEFLDALGDHSGELGYTELCFLTPWVDRMTFEEALLKLREGHTITDGDVTIRPGEIVRDLNLTTSMQVSWNILEESDA